MFRKILLSFFPSEEIQSWLSPIKFHLKLIAPKLYYWLSLKQSITNRRSVFTDSRFSYFIPADIVLKDPKYENFFYSYKSYALLNGFDNYSLFTILPVVSLVSFVKYFSFLPNEKFLTYLRPLLFSINYLMILFFAHFKEYDKTQTKDEQIKFMIKLIDEIVFYLEYTKDINKKNYEWAKKIAEKIIKIIQQDTDCLMFLYNTTLELSKIFQSKWFSMLKLYEYLVVWMLMDFPNETEFRWILEQTTKKIYLKRYSLYLDADIITLCNVIWGDPVHINYLVHPTNEDFLPYFAESLDTVWNIDFLSTSLVKIVDQVLDFKYWAKALIKSLKEFNADYIDIVVSPDMTFQQVQELLSKSMLDSVKKISVINEQFMDYFVLLISRKYSREGDNYQWEFKNYKKPKINIWEYIENLSLSEQRDLQWNYIFLDKNYFKWSYFYRTKKKVDNPKNFYFFYHPVAIREIIEQSQKILLEDFTKKTLIQTIWVNNYKQLFKNTFQSTVSELIWRTGYKKYISFFSFFKWLNFTEWQLINFRKNIYYPDFLLFYEFLKKSNKKVSYEEILIFSQLKQSLFGYLIIWKLVKNKWYFTQLWKNALFFYKYYEDIENLLDNFDKFDEFIDFFVKVKQNKNFVKIMEKLLLELPENHRKWFIFDCTKDVTLYNKRMFNL